MRDSLEHLHEAQQINQKQHINRKIISQVMMTYLKDSFKNFTIFVSLHSEVDDYIDQDEYKAEHKNTLKSSIFFDLIPKSQNK